ncbi:hypothetical protein Q8A73_021718 [Channa argus]|nr:hypothetical protein Q8A73_021718 [Channa argus]
MSPTAAVCPTNGDDLRMEPTEPAATDSEDTPTDRQMRSDSAVPQLSNVLTFSCCSSSTGSVVGLPAPPDQNLGSLLNLLNDLRCLPELYLLYNSPLSQQFDVHRIRSVSTLRSFKLPGRDTGLRNRCVQCLYDLVSAHVTSETLLVFLKLRPAAFLSLLYSLFCVDPSSSDIHPHLLSTALQNQEKEKRDSLNHSLVLDEDWAEMCPNATEAQSAIRDQRTSVSELCRDNSRHSTNRGNQTSTEEQEEINKWSLREEAVMTHINRIVNLLHIVHTDYNQYLFHPPVSTCCCISEEALTELLSERHDEAQPTLKWKGLREFLLHAKETLMCVCEHQYSSLPLTFIKTDEKQREADRSTPH